MRSALAVSVNGPPRPASVRAAVALAAGSRRSSARRAALLARRTSGRSARSAATRRPRRRAATAPRRSLAADRQQLAPRHRPAARAESGGRIRSSASMDEDAALGAAGIGVERVERLEAQDMAGIDRVGIAQPGLDLRSPTAGAAAPRAAGAAPAGGSGRYAPAGRQRRGRAASDLGPAPSAPRARPRAAPCRAAAASATARSARPRSRAARVSATSRRAQRLGEIMRGDADRALGRRRCRTRAASAATSTGRAPPEPARCPR